MDAPVFKAIQPEVSVDTSATYKHSHTLARTHFSNITTVIFNSADSHQ